MEWLRYVALVFAFLWGSMASLGQKSALTPLDQTPLDKKILEADAMQDRGALQEAQVAYESVLQTLIAREPGPQLGHVLNGLSNVASSLGKHNDAVDFAARANRVYRKLGDAKGQAYALNSQGIAQGELGLYSDAQASFRQALGFCRAIQDFKTEVRTLNNLGNAYYFPGNYLEALRSYQDAWRVLDSRASDPWNGYWQQITKINEATLYQRLGRYQTALLIYRQIQTSKGLTASDKAHLLTNLGALYRRLGDPWKALYSYRAALSLYSHQHDAAGEISVLKNIGIVYALDQEDLGRARQSFEKSLARASQSHNQREEMQAHLYLGET
jgi:tetratricopeptide (TPR) repeat protein